MDGFKTENTEEEEGNSRSDRSYHQEPEDGETQQHTLQTLDEETTQLSSQAQPNPDQPVPPIELQESVFGEEELGSSDTTVVTRQADGSLQDQIDEEVHENHQQSDMMLVKSVRQSSPIQPVKVLEQSTFCEGEISSPQLKGDKAAITQQTDGSIQVRIDDGARGNHHRSNMMLVQSGSASELCHLLGNGVACVPVTSLEDNVSIEEISHPESKLLVTGRHGGHFKTKTPVHNDSPFSVQIPSPGIQTNLFVLERRFPSVPRNETSVSVHFLVSQDFSEREVCALVSRMEEQPGTKLVRFCIEHMDLQTNTPCHFHTTFIQDQVTVRFQLVNQVQRNFRLKDASMAEKVITVSQIKSLSQRWMEQPGAKAEICVESLGEVGQLCENHLRIILQYGDTILTLLLPIWSCKQNVSHYSSLEN